jgi:peptidoglycan/LPS O-acetylase OafA/YrhL
MILSAAPARIASLQSLRLIAAVGVLQYHLWANYLGVTIGHPGTDLFLGLVGFFACVAEGERISVGDWALYMRQRYARLYVTYIPLFSIVLAAKLHGATAGWAVRSFLFLPLSERLPVIGATWMVSMFLVFYWLFSVAFHARKESAVWPLFLAWAAGIMSYTWLGWHPPLADEWNRVVFEERNLVAIMGYAAGLAHRRVRSTVFRARAAAVIGVVGLIGGTLLLNVGALHQGRSLFVGIPVACCILGFAWLERGEPDNPVIRRLTHPLLVWLGATSYVLYLSHGPLLAVWNRVLPITVGSAPAATLAALLAAAAGYAVWEEPVLRYVRTGVWRRPSLPRLAR